MPVEHARKAKSINNGFISRLALSLDEYPGMKLYWRAGHSAILHPADLCSRALTKYDGSQTPEQNGFDGPWQYRDCPVFNVLRGIWDAEKITDVDAVEVGAMDVWMDQDVPLASLEAQVALGQLTRAEPDEENHVVETEAHAVQWLHKATGLEELSIAAQLG